METLVIGEKELSDAPIWHCKIFNHSKGYGFITPDEGAKDIFVHVSAVQQSGLTALDEGARVTFETEDDSRGGRRSSRQP